MNRRVLFTVAIAACAIFSMSAVRQDSPKPKDDDRLVEVLRGMIGRPCTFSARDGASGLVVYPKDSDEVDTKIAKVGADYLVLESDDETRWVPIASQDFIVQWK